MSKGPYRCKFEGCGDTFLRESDLKKHLSLAHDIKHPISQIELLKSWGYADLEERKDETIEFEISIF